MHLDVGGLELRTATSKETIFLDNELFKIIDIPFSFSRANGMSMI